MAKERLVVMMGTDPVGRGGIASVIFGYREAGLADRWPVVFLTTHRQGSALDKVMTWASAWVRLAWLVFSGQCGVLHLHAASRGSFWRKYTFHLLARLGGVPIIWHIHGAEFDRFCEIECGRWRRLLVRDALRHAHRVIALSGQWAAFLQKLERRANVVVIHNCVAVGAPVSAGGRQMRTALFLGRITEVKGIYDLLQAWQRLAGTLPDVRLLIAGVGEGEKASDCARQLEIEDRVEFLGWVSGPAKLQAIAGAAVLILPSHAEGLPMVLLEAMALATPVIATAVGGVPDLITDGETGLLIRPGDIDQIAAALRRVFIEPGLAARLGGEGQRRVARDFSMDSALSNLGLIYRLAGMRAKAPAMVRRD